MDISCVVCLLQKNPMVNLSNKVNETSLQQMLAAHSQIVSPSDYLDSTKLLCQECTKELLIVNNFYEKCRNAEKFFERKLDQDSIDLVPGHKLELHESEADIIIHEVDSGEIIQRVDDIIECEPYLIEVVDPKSLKSALYCCSDCGKNFSCQSSLTAHIRTHTGERPYSCPITGCNKSFKTAGAKKLHEKRHTGDKRFVCPQDGCEMRFVEVSNLKRHLNTHLKRKPFICQACGKGFGRLELLQMHERTHTGEKPFVCHCGKSFAQQGVLAAHKRIHSGEKPNKCTICDSAFIKGSALRKHMERHASTVNKLDFNSTSFPMEFLVIDNRLNPVNNWLSDS